MRKGSLYILPFLLLCALTSGKDFGTRGNTFAIIEPDMIQAIKMRLKTMEENGEIEELNRRLTDRTKSYVKRPKGIRLPYQAQGTSRLFDPSYILAADIHDHQGTLLHASGTIINPLKTMPLSTTLYFLDADDPRQLAWIENKIHNNLGRYKIILLSGDHLEVVKRLKVRIYFDQGGVLQKYFALQALPASLRQKGDKLEIIEGADR